jgi:serine/threonine protein kinase
MGKNKRSQREVSMLKEGQSEYTVELIQVLEENEKLYLVMELMSGGNLLSRVIQTQSLPEPTVQRIAFHLLKGVHHLHEELDICHNDLHPANLLFTDDTDKGMIKIADFGSATAGACMPKSSSAAAPYSAPEGSTGKHPPTAAADMWSVGVVLYFCLVGQQPCLQKGHEALLDRIHRVGMTNLSRHGKQFLTNLLHMDPDVRLTAEEALEHPWMANVVQRQPEKDVRARLRSESSVSSITSAPSLSGRCRRPGKRIVRSFSRLITYLKRSDDEIPPCESFLDATEACTESNPPIALMSYKK